MIMRLALLADLHGNPIALDAVLADIQAQGNVDAYMVLGDLAAIGYDPIGALERLVKLPHVYFVRGNTDRYLVTGERPGPMSEEVQAKPGLLSRFTQVARSFAWTQGAVSVTGWLAWLAELPLEQRLALPDGTRLLGVHAAPGCDDGHGVYPTMSRPELEALLAGCQADLVCVGHNHWPLDLVVDGVRVVNPGSVSNPFPPDLRASYTLLEADALGYRLEFRRVDYDHQAVVEAVQRVRHPAAEYVISFMLGQNQPFWQQLQDASHH